jgi:outer membrane receptor for ferrienterochelin and colicins
MLKSAWFCLFLMQLSVLAGQQSHNDTLLHKDMDQVVVTAQFSPTDARETVNSVRLINRKTIEQKSASNLQELLQMEANIRISQDPLLGSEISINGLKGENVKILIDGVPVVGRLNGNIDAGQIPLHAIQKIEIIEGAQSLLYGSEAAAGVINIITRKSQVNGFESEAQLHYDAPGFRNINLRSGLHHKNWVFQGTGFLQQFVPVQSKDSSRDQVWNPKAQHGFRALARFNPDDRTDIRISGNWMREKVDNLGEIKRPVFKPYAFDDYFFTNRRDLSFQADRTTQKGLYLQSVISYNQFQRIKNSYRYDFEKSLNELIPGMQDTSRADGWLARFTVASNQNTSSIQYLVGFENYLESATGTRLADTVMEHSNDKLHTNDLGIFASGKYKIYEKLTLQAGARYNWNMRYGSALTPSAWLLWEPREKLQVKASVAQGFRSPSLKELYFNFVDINHFVTGNARLTPERSLNIRSEIVIHSLKAGDMLFALNLTGFYNNIDDRIILSALGPVHYEYQNVDTWRTAGGSLRVKWSLNDWLTLQTECVRTGFDQPENVQELRTGNYLWSTDVANDMTVTLISNVLNFNIWHKYTGRTPYFYNDNGTTKQGVAESWNMLNAGCTYQIPKAGIRLNAGVKNILNVQNFQFNNDNGIHIEASSQQSVHWGRTFFIGCSYVFKK